MSSTCTIWRGPQSFRIRTRYLPPWMTLPFFAVTGTLAAIFFRDPKSGPAVIVDVLALTAIFATLFGFNCAAAPGRFLTWNSVAGARFRIREIPAENIVEIAASSVWIMSSTMHSLQFRQSGSEFREVLMFWNKSDANASALALTDWLNERRPAGAEPVQFTQIVKDLGRAQGRKKRV